MKKYEFTREKKVICGRTVKRIRAVRDFAGVKAGDLGGWIESEKNLSHVGNCWVEGNAIVCGDAKVSENALVCRNATVSENARVYGHSYVSGNAKVSGYALVYEDAVVSGNTEVSEYEVVGGDTLMYAKRKEQSYEPVSLH